MMEKLWFQRLFLVFLLAFSGIGRAGEIFGKVVGVSDGDTITVLVGKTQVKIRLNGIDCPEGGQAFGAAAKKFTGDVVFGKAVKVKTFGTDRYGRTIGEVLLPDGTNLNQELVAAGLAWWFQKYAPNDKVLQSLEKKARSEKKGLWADPKAIAPWEFRRPQNRARQAGEDNLTVYVTKTGKKYHFEYCEYLKGGKIPISLGEAKKKGYSPCSKCVAP